MLVFVVARQRSRRLFYHDTRKQRNLVALAAETNPSYTLDLQLPNGLDLVKRRHKEGMLSIPQQWKWRDARPPHNAGPSCTHFILKTGGKIAIVFYHIPCLPLVVVWRGFLHTCCSIIARSHCLAAVDYTRSSFLATTCPVP